MSYVTGKTIKELREKTGITQKQLAESINVSDKAVSKWETGRGLPDVGVIEDLAKALKVSLAELLTGDYKINENISANIKKMHFYICPVCGNIITSVGCGSFSCCGITLPEADIDDCDENHIINIETVEDEYLVTLDHAMNKKHYISFIAYLAGDRLDLAKLYPEQDISVRFKRKGHGYIYAYCNRHGMFRITV